MMDDYQGLQDPHALERGFRNKINWRGARLDGKLIEQGVQANRVCKLTKSFRSPELITNHIKKEKLVPSTDVPEASAVEGLGVHREELQVQVRGYSQQWLAAQLADRLYASVMLDGNHPGHCTLRNLELQKSLLADLLPSIPIVTRIRPTGSYSDLLVTQ